MSRLLEWKEKLQSLYAGYSTYIDKGIRFIVAITSFLLISSNIGFMEKLAKPIISIVLAAVCAFLPMIVTVIVSAGLMLAHMFVLSEGIALINVYFLFSVYTEEGNYFIAYADSICV